MNELIKTKPFLVIAILALGMLVAACSPSAEKLNQDGNQAYTEQAYLEALEAYQTAQIESPELAEPYYNAANTFYRQGQYEQALEQLQQALQFADEESLAENSLFNLGNNFFNTQDLETAIEAYKGALLLDPQDHDAKYNLELALQQQQQQQEQEQQQEQQEQSQEEQDQEENQDESQNGENQDEQEQEQSGDQSENQDEGEQGEDQSENNDQGNEEQQQEENQNQNNGQPQDGENQENEGGQPGQMPPPGQRMTEEQAKQLLAALAEDMDTLQERLGEILFVQKPPPVQDW
jgi:tetratricopeptide (TPR) repeat protein